MSEADARPPNEGAGVIVVGAGVAGTGAALAAARAGATVTLLDGGTGASTLATGAIDLMPWPNAIDAAAEVHSTVRQALEALGGYALPDGGARVLTSAGMIRRSRGHDASLLDVAPLAEQRIGVVRCRRPGWDADALADAWGSAYGALDAVVLRHVDERSLPDTEFAARHDDDARLGWLAQRLREALSSAGQACAALVLPPSLGVDRVRAAALSEHVGLPCGEAASLPGGPSGVRFERARDRALASAGVACVRARAKAAQWRGNRWRVATEDGAALEADAVVVATGGLLGGGLEYTPSEIILSATMPPHARPPLCFSMDAPLTLGAWGRPLERPGSLFGSPPESLAWPFTCDALLDRAGALVEADERARVVVDDDRPAMRGLFAAGDLVADAPRTWLAALSSGVRAGIAAAR